MKKVTKKTGVPSAPHPAATATAARYESYRSASGAEVTVTYLGSFTVMSDAHAAAHPEAAERAAEQNAAFEAVIREARES